MGSAAFDLGLERAGITTVLQVERDPFCRAVLERHWPGVRRIADVRDVTVEACEGAQLIYGGFPCQPVADQGERRVENDVRWLWPEFYRLIRGVHPSYVVIENVPGLLKRGGHRVFADLAEGGFDAEWSTVTTRAFGAPHHRERLFIVAYPRSDRRLLLEELAGDYRDAWQLPTAALGEWKDWRRWLAATVATGDWDDAEAEVLGVDDGLSARLDRKRIKALGNAVVPQVAEYIGRRLVEFDRAVDNET